MAVDFFQIAFNHGPIDDPTAPGFTWTSPADTAGVSLLRFTWDRGRPSDVDKVSPGQGTAVLLDTSGALDPTNPNSPWWNAGEGRTHVNPRKPARLQLLNPIDSTWHPVLTGYVKNINYQVGETGEYAFVTVTIQDDLGLLAAAEVIPGTSGAGVAGASGNAIYNAQQVNDRILAVLADAALSLGGTSWPTSKYRLASGNVAVQQKSYAAKTSMLTVIDDAVDAELPGVANRYCRRDNVFRFRGRYERFDWQNYTVANGGDLNVWSVGDAHQDAATYIIMQNGGQAGVGPFQFDRGDDNLVNAAIAYPAGIKPGDIAGQLVHDNLSISDFGLCSISFEDLITLNGDESNPGPNLNANDETKEYANYYVQNRKLPQNRPGTIAFGSEDPAGPNANAWALLCDLELTDVMKLKTTHPGGGGFADEVFFVEHIAGQCTPGPVPIVTLQVEVSPGAHFTDNIFAT